MMRLLSCSWAIALGVIALQWTTPATAATVPFTETFSSNAAGWTDGSSGNGAATLVHSAAGGPGGSAFVSNTSTIEAVSFGTRLLFRAHAANNASGNAFVGDWLDAGVETLSVYFRHDASTSLDFYARIAGTGGAGASLATGFTVPANQWTLIEIPIIDSDPPFTSYGSSTFNGVFSNIQNIQLGVYAPADFSEVVTFDLARVSIVPEPGSLALLAIAGAAVFARRRRFKAIGVTSPALAATLVICSGAMAAPMALIDPELPGTTQYDEWTNASLTIAGNPGFPGFPGSGAWPNPIGSDAAGSGDATLNKIANGTGGGPYPASGSIYYGGFSGDLNVNGGTLAVIDTTPVANLANLVFQIQIGEAWTYDFFNHTLPSLTYTTAGGDTTLTADDAAHVVLLEQFFNGTVPMPTGDEPVYINTYLLQWNLADAAGITAISVSFTAVQHAQLYALRLDQSDVFAQVPEPASLALIGAGVLTLLLRR
jgi:hypothetical protein